MKKIILFIAVLCWSINSIYSQKQLNQYQYWFDNDFANVSSTTFPPQDSLQLLANISTSGLYSGLHIFHFRCKDTSGLWSSVISQFFFKNASNASSGQKQIVKNEYWFDTDFNNRTTQTVTGQDSISFIGNLNTDSLIPGLHIFHYRCKDNAGLWSSVISQFFFKNASGASAGQKQIVKQEYWFDTDFNKRVTQTITGQDSISFISNLNVDSLLYGLHVFHYRCRDNSGLWSSVVSQFFVKNFGNYNLADNKLTTYRYWFDEQQNTFTNTMIVPPMDSVIVPHIDLTNVLNGDYIIHFQYKDNKNLWSSPTSDSIKVQQIPQAAGAISGLHPVCQPTDSVLYTVQPIFNATSYIWSFPSGIIGTSDSNYIWVNYTDTALSGVITVKGHNEYGDGLASSLNITVYSPDTAGIISGLTPVCQGVNNVIYTVPTINNSDYYIWTLPSGVSGSSSTNSITASYSTSAISGNITVKGHNACGDGVAAIKAIIVDPLPVAAGTITGSSTVCQGQNSVTYTVPTITHATSYVWTLPTGATGTSSSSSITVNYGTSAVSGTVTVKGHNNCGDGIISTKSITVNPLPVSAGTITGLSTVCQGQSSVTYTVPTITYATSYVWTLPTGATGTSSTASITVNYGTSAVSGNITVKGHNDCGDGIVSTKTITVNPLPVAAGTITGLATVCQGQNTVTYSVPTITHATSYIWTLPTGATGTSSTASITVNYGTSAVSGNITVKGHNDCGDGIVSTKAITVNPLPVAAGVITGFGTVCQGQSNVNYVVPIITNATSYVWTLPTGATGTTSTASINVNYGTSAVSGNITVKGNNACGDGTISIKAITVNPLPVAAGTITGLATVCQGQSSVTYSVPTITNATSYVWTLPTGATGTSSTASITVNYGTSAVSGNITVKGNNACGDGIVSIKAINVNPLPIAAGTITGLATVCQGQTSVTYSVPTITNATSYVWTLPTGATGTSSTASITVNYGTSAVSGNITVKGNNACGDGTVSTKAITVNPLPIAAGTISGLATVCQGQSSVIYSVPTITNATSYVWTLPTGATGTSSTSSITVNYGTSAVSGNITVKGNNACGDGSVSTKAITVNPLPVAAGTITGLATVCQGQNSVVYTVATITNATSYSWTLPVGVTGTSSTASITVNYGTSAISGNITVKGSNACGDGEPSSKAITVNPLPVAAGTISGLSGICGTMNNVQYTVPAISHATSYSWTLPVGVTGSSTSTIINANYTSNAQSGNITVKGSNACGYGDSSILAVIVNQNQSLPFTESFESSTFPPTDWLINNSDNNLTWIRKQYSGGGTNQYAATMPFYNYITNIGTYDILKTPLLDLTQDCAPALKFKVAYRQFPGYSDTLLIKISTDCGNTFNNIIYNKGGNELATASYIFSEFTPASTTEWRTETIDLSAFYGQNIIISFVGVNNYGNNLYIDDVEVSTLKLNYLAVDATSVSETYTDLGSTGNIISVSNFDNASSLVQNIGFSFDYNGSTFKQFILNSNGFVKLGNTALSSDSLFYNTAQGISGGAINSTNAADINILAAFNHDLTSGTLTPEFRSFTSGIAPNRVCTIQFKNLRDKTTNPLQQFNNISFQIKLYETSNTIEFVYDNWQASLNSPANKTAACGLKGSGVSDCQLLMVEKSNSQNWSEVVFHNSNYVANALNFWNSTNTLPLAGRTLRFKPIPLSKQVNIIVLLEGLTNPNNGLMVKAQDENGDHFGGDTADIISVFLASTTLPYAITDTFNVGLQTNGNATFSIPSTYNSDKYIIIKHRNHLETWSAAPVSFAGDTIVYNFNTDAYKAFGDNQKEISHGKYALLVGDVNQDGVVDLSDLVAMDADLTNGTVGYVVYDLNCDGVVDLSDLVIIDENLTNGVVVMTP
jgi:hypothetical protein